MNQVLKRQFKKTPQSTSLLAVIAFGLLILVCVSLSRTLAATEPGKCNEANRAIKGFKATSTKEPLTEHLFVNAHGNQKMLADYLGKGIILNFWATWCVPCVKEMPQLDTLKKKLSADEIEVLAISVDRAGTTKVKKFFRLNNIKNLDILTDRSGEILKKTKTRGLPTTLLINSEGFEVGRVLGVLEWDAPNIVTFLRKCLKP